MRSPSPRWPRTPTIPEEAKGRQSTPRCISRWRLTGRRWGRACSAGSDRLRSAPRRMAPGTRRRHTGSLRAGSACLHSRHANELLVTNQRRAPAGGEAGDAIFIPLHPFSYWPQPHLDRLLSTSAPSYFQTADGGTGSANPHGWAPQPCRQQQPCPPIPSPAKDGAGWLRAAGSPPSLLPTGRMESSQPHVSMPTSSQQEEGVELQGHGQRLKCISFWHPKGHHSWPFIPQPDGPMSNDDIRSPDPQ